MQGKWAAFPDPRVLVPSPPRTLHKPVMVLCHLGCRWPHRCGHGDSGLDWAMRVTVVPGPGHLGAHAVRAALNESHSAAGFLGACPQSGQHPSLTHLPLCVCPCPGFRRNLKGILSPETLRSTGRETAAQRAVVTGYKGSWGRAGPGAKTPDSLSCAPSSDFGIQRDHPCQGGPLFLSYGSPSGATTPCSPH